VDGKWIRRKNKVNIISRVYMVSPSERERYALRTLLLHRKDVQSFVDLKTGSDGFVYETFRESPISYNLLGDDTEHRSTLNECILFQMPSALRKLFAILCTHSSPANCLGLWDERVAAWWRRFALFSE